MDVAVLRPVTIMAHYDSQCVPEDTRTSTDGLRR